MSEQRRRHVVEQHLRLAVLAVRGQSEEGVRDGAAADAGLLEQRRETVAQHGAQAVHADLEMVGGGPFVRRDEVAVAIDQRELGLGAAAVDAEEKGLGHGVTATGGCARPAPPGSRCR